MKEYRTLILSAAWAIHIAFVILGYSFVGTSVLLPSIFICGLASWFYNPRIGLINLLLTHPCHILIMMYNLRDPQGWKVALEPQGLAIGLAVQLCTILFITILKRNLEEIETINNNMKIRIRERNEELSQITDYMIARSERERSNISDVFCNIVGQQQSDLLENAKQLRLKLNQKKSPHLMSIVKLEELAHINIQQVCDMRKSLSFQALEARGIEAALTDMCDRISQVADIHFSVNIHRSIYDLTDNTCLTIYRIAHEAVTNALRHGKPTLISISLQHLNNTCILEIINNGIPISGIPKYGLGMKLMRQRAETLKATFTLDPISSNETRFRCVIPFLTKP